AGRDRFRAPELVIVDEVVLFNGPPVGGVLQPKPLYRAIGVGYGHLAVLETALHMIGRTRHEEDYPSRISGQRQGHFFRVVIPLRDKDDVPAIAFTRRRPARAAARRPVSSISAVALTCPAHAPMPCFGVASETKGERGERYSFLKIWVTRSLKYPVNSTGAVLLGIWSIQSRGGAIAVSRGLAAVGRTGAGPGCAAVLHWIRTWYFCAAGVWISKRA